MCVSCGSGAIIRRLWVRSQILVVYKSKILTTCCLWCFVHSTAKEVEAIVRNEGATPATVGVIDGQVCVGLTSEELDHLAQSRTSVKVSRRDLPYVLSKVRHTLTRFKPKTSYFHRSCYAGLQHRVVIPQRLSGGTTVSATMIAAHRAGIPVFVTGGIGGVHRDGEDSKQTGVGGTGSDPWINI